MTNPLFRPATANHDIEVLFDGVAHKGQYHLEHDNVVVSYQGASKMVKQGDDNAALALTILREIITAKHGRH